METGWLSEINGTYPPMYWQGDGWSPSHAAAVRFARKTDGERVVKTVVSVLHQALQEIVVREHAWTKT